MKLVKFVPAIAATVVLAACSTASQVASTATDAVKATGNAVAGAATATVDTVKDATNATVDGVKGAAKATKETVKGAMGAKPAFETAGYFCDVQGKRKVVSATYTFVNGKPETATLSIDGKSVGDLKFDAKYQDGSRFVAGNRVWSLDYGFAQNTVSKTVPVQYRSNDKIVAKNCEIAK